MENLRDNFLYIYIYVFVSLIRIMILEQHTMCFFFSNVTHDGNVNIENYK